MSTPYNLTTKHLEAFERRGVVRLPGFYPRADIETMADRLWTFLETRYDARRDRPESWPSAHLAKFQALKRSGAFDALGSRRLCDLADVMLGAGMWDKPAHWGGSLVTFPTAAPSLPRPPWHLDITGAETLNPLPVLRVFTFLEPLEAHGGGTLYVAGSHRLAMEIEQARGATVRSAEVCGRLKADHPWFANLFATPAAALRGLINAEAMIGSQAVRLEEMTVAPGDLIIMHPAILHGAAHNSRDRPRMMLTEWINRRGGQVNRREI